MYASRSASRPITATSTLTLTQDDALSVLEYWHASAERLTLVYGRAGERVTRIGHGRVRNATPRELRIDTDCGRLRFTMQAAAFEFGRLAPRAPAHVRETQSDGLLIRLELDDWIFLRPSYMPARERAACVQARSSSRVRPHHASSGGWP